ncbi:MAG: rhomboid family intramembrane serine protease [Candidatus Palauibacterales bacterium]|nr:rhomboid family intramembrane serine protease [Candidatus Palauibacterales bacterium]
MLPLKDENPTDRTPYVTVAFIAANVLVWLVMQDAGGGAGFVDSLCRLGVIPAYLTGGLEAGETITLGRATCRVGGSPALATLTSMFAHGSWLHLIMNMWFLWVFGNNIEDALGPARFPFFYLLAGVAAVAAHVALSPDSAAPMVGASGAISGVMGAYLVLYPRAEVVTLIPIFVFFRILVLPAWVMLGLWFLYQAMQGVLLGGTGTGVAIWAHVGGFVAGLATVKLFALSLRS